MYRVHLAMHVYRKRGNKKPRLSHSSCGVKASRKQKCRNKGEKGEEKTGSMQPTMCLKRVDKRYTARNVKKGKYEKKGKKKKKKLHRMAAGSLHTFYAAFFFEAPSTAALAASLANFSCRAMPASTPMPPKTRPTPSHCIWVRRWPKATTERIMVNILRVTVTVTRRTEEKVDRV